MINLLGLESAIEQAKALQELTERNYHAQLHSVNAMSVVLQEETLRTTNPAVKDAWERYQIVLRLAKQ